MKFEQLLQIYWSKGFVYGGRTYKFDYSLNSFFLDKPGLSRKNKDLFLKRFELYHFVTDNSKSLNTLSLDKRKIINMYFSRFGNINNSIFELIKFNLVRLYLIKSFKGRAQAMGKPSRGQRTWSNASNAYKVNRVLRAFILQVKKNNVIEKKTQSLNLKYLKKKTKKTSPKIKMLFVKQYKNLWF